MMMTVHEEAVDDDAFVIDAVQRLAVPVPEQARLGDISDQHGAALACHLYRIESHQRRLSSLLSTWLPCWNVSLRPSPGGGRQHREPGLHQGEQGGGGDQELFHRPHLDQVLGLGSMRRRKGGRHDYRKILY